MKKPKKSCASASDANYEVGYGKPPRHTRFMMGDMAANAGRRHDHRIARLAAGHEGVEVAQRT